MPKKFIYLLLAIVLALGMVSLFNYLELGRQTELPAQAAGTDNVRGWAWSENIGWISFNCLNEAVCDGTNYGVNIDPLNGKFSGYAWSEHIGWISFNRDDTGTPPGPPFNTDENFIAKVKAPGQVGKSDVEILGWARACGIQPGTESITCGGDGWDGWIKFTKDDADSGADYSTYLGTDYQFYGWAWGSDVVGWISFNCADRGICDQSDYKVVLEAPAPILTLVAQPSSSIFSGQTITLYWTTENVTTLTASSDPPDGDWDGPIPGDEVASGSREVSPATTTTYTLTGTSLAGDVVKSVTITIKPVIKWREVAP